MKLRAKLTGSLFVLAVSTVTAAANVTLPDVISNAMVLQCDQAVPIWGQADPGETITVRFGMQNRQTVAGKDGKWIVRLGAVHANASPAVMTIEGRNKIELRNILVGEVWLVSGQ